MYHFIVNDFGDFNDEDDNEVDRAGQFFHFVDVVLFVSLFSGSPNESLYFRKVTGKHTASMQKSLRSIRPFHICWKKNFQSFF